MILETEMEKNYDSTIGYMRAWLRDVVGARGKVCKRENKSKVNLGWKGKT